MRSCRVGGETRVDHETTRVRFAEMSESEIDWYVASGEPVGKAGAYGIQGKAALFIEEIEGDYFNIMGLPIRLVYELAASMNSHGKAQYGTKKSVTTVAPLRGTSEQHCAAVNIDSLTVDSSPFIGSKQQRKCCDFFRRDQAILRAHLLQ